jgi:hypothetical protein
MSEAKITSLGSAYREIFAVLEAAGFTLTVTRYSPESFGNFVVACRSSAVDLKVTNDRGQIFIDLKTGDDEWLDKEKILASAGIVMSRYKTIDGLWTGYEPAIQASDLKANLGLLIKVASGEAPSEAV